MTIGFDASRAFINHRTGTENYSYQILYHLSKIDQQNKYLVYLRPGANLAKIKRLHKWPANFSFQIINYHFLWTQLGLAKRTFTDHLDVLFVPAHTLPILHQPGLKTVMTVHDLGSEFLPQTHQLKQRLYLNFTTHSQIKSASLVIAVSQATKKDILKKVTIDPKKITVVYEGFDQQLFKPVSNDQLLNTLRHFNLVDKDYFLFVGTIQPRKNLHNLILAYQAFLQNFSAQQHQGINITHSQTGKNSHLKSWQPQPKTAQLPYLILAGTKGWLAEKIYQLPQHLGITDKVKFLGFVPDHDLPALYSGARAFLFPSLFEGFGLPILESMACGCPVLTSNSSSMPEVAGEAAILVNPNSVESITQGINKIYNQPPGKQLGFQQAEQFSWEQAARQTLAVLEKATLD
ncbi:glycosyltransferase family 4 protein [Patescibacteria group bacterium]|nr:glycosyltransferase family 4 protein [Patescibacteria group bacterium]